MNRLSPSIAVASILITSVLLPGLTAAESGVVTISFGGPISTEGDFTIGSEWAILEFSRSAQESRFIVGSQKNLHATYNNYTWATNNYLGHAEIPPLHETGERILQFNGATALWDSVGYIGIRARSIVISYSGTSEIKTVDPSELPSLLTGAPEDDATSDWAAQANQAQVVGFGSLTPVNITIAGLEAVEFLGASISCNGTCPTGGAVSREEIGTASIEKYSFERIVGWTGGGEVQAMPARLVFGGHSLDIEGSGLARLPRAELDGNCQCIFDGESTLILTGNLAFAGIRPAFDDRMVGLLSGTGVTAFSDELEVSIPKLAITSGAVLAAAVSFAILLKLLLLPLFTRLSKQQALEHPKRQRIFSYIQEHPGANFREVSRETDIAAGTVRHHLTVLERAGHIVEHAHQGTIRLFENHGKFDATWVDAVLLREPPLAQLHAWVKEHPAVAQKDVLEAMEARGWSRSTTQHRLARLVQGGVLTLRLQGRLKMYAVSDPQNRKPPGLVVPGLASHWSTNANASHS